MTGQQKSSDLLDAFQQEIKALEKRETELQQNITLLEGRSGFLQAEIKKLEEHEQELCNKQTAIVDQAKQKQARAEKRLIEAEDALTKLTIEHLAKKDQLDQEITDLNTALNGVNDEIKERQQVVASLDEQKKVALEQIDELDKQLKEKQAAFEAIDERIETAGQNAAMEIKEYAAQQATAKKQAREIRHKADEVIEELEDWEAKLAKVKQQVQVAEKQHQEFATKEQSARAAIQVKIESLDRREEELEMKIATARRRHGVSVDNL